MVRRPPFEFLRIPLTQPLSLKLEIHKFRQSHLSKSDILAIGVLGDKKAIFEESLIKKYLDLFSHDSIIVPILTQMLKRANFNESPGRIVSARGSEAGSSFGDIFCVNLGGKVENEMLCRPCPRDSKHEPEVSPYNAAKTGKALACALHNIEKECMTLVFRSADISSKALRCFLESFISWLIPDERFKSQKQQEPKKSLENLTVLLDIDDTKDLVSYKTELSNAIAVASGERLTRELADTPANICTTESLAREAIALCNAFDHFECTVLNAEDCKRRSMGAYLAVSQGSLYEAQFIHMVYRPDKTSIHWKLAFIGKAICMDTGGYNLKVNCNIEQMKFDMGGAAAVMGAARITGLLQPPHVEVHFIIPAAENMISARASRPGDIVTASNGVTIEIGNTDAEGRLTLADALHYAATEVKPDFIFDCATLTGACKVALGPSLGGLYSTDKHWGDIVLHCAHSTGTPVWPLPLFEEYSRSLDSKIADINNMSSTRYGGSITAALFLKRFVPSNIPWCHLDMAGPVYKEDDKGGSGYAAKLIAEIIEHASNSLKK